MRVWVLGLTCDFVLPDVFFVLFRDVGTLAGGLLAVCIVGL